VDLLATSEAAVAEKGGRNTGELDANSTARPPTDLPSPFRHLGGSSTARRPLWLAHRPSPSCPFRLLDHTGAPLRMTPLFMAMSLQSIRVYSRSFAVSSSRRIAL
jgi:hypothetical protein